METYNWYPTTGLTGNIQLQATHRFQWNHTIGVLAMALLAFRVSTYCEIGKIIQFRKFGHVRPSSLFS